MCQTLGFVAMNLLRFLFLGSQPLEQDKLPTGKTALSKTWD